MARRSETKQSGFLARLFGRFARNDGQATPDAQVSDNQFSLIISIASDAIITTNEDLLIVNFNRGAEEIFGYLAEEIVGRHINLLIPARFHTSHNEHVRTFARSGVPARRMGERRQILGVRKNGEEFPAEA